MCIFFMWGLPVVFAADMLILEISTIFVGARWFMFFYDIKGGDWR